MGKVAIHHPDDPTRPKTIPAERFNPQMHTRWGEGVEPEDGNQDTLEAREPGSPEGFDSLPDDFPGKGPLEDAGITTIHGVRGVKDYDEITGIGQVTEQKIVSYLSDLEAEE